MAEERVAITVAEGDGIGPEIMAATLHILAEAGANLDIRKIEVGERVYEKGFRAGIEPSSWDAIREGKAFLKAPITTPQGGGFKSLNVTIRAALGLYANVRPSVAYFPFVETKHPDMDVVIIRENEEDLYTGIEYRQTDNNVHALKIITRTGCERIVRYAFEYAKVNRRKKVTCFTKDNILKLSDGLFHKVFQEMAQEYPDIENEHWIIDIGAAKLADRPDNFDVVVMPNLYGDILSDIAAQIAGSVGLAGSANIGLNTAMFEAIHGSAPRRAGQNLANPSGLLLAATMMLVHIGQPEIAARIHNAWLCTLEAGIHTYDIFKDHVSKRKVGTKEFAEAIVKRLGKTPNILKAAEYADPMKLPKREEKITREKAEKAIVGVDVFIDFSETVHELRQKLQSIENGNLQLALIYNRGSKIWPEGMPEVLCGDCWRCRFIGRDPSREVGHKEIAELLMRMAQGGVDFVHTEHLYTFDGIPCYSLSQEEQ